uniref:Uncharacterized protein n=1 Tax=Utricularia reniformis TaxID=192314 RepID=A0A1Y0B1Z2_9LAMI|nr:hypothetical protein AEK19_MT1165 [Utricularia reniformis]ART31379.1 hypothetical protein AEK19_MT1165 [Utricularia reniformis]
MHVQPALLAFHHPIHNKSNESRILLTYSNEIFNPPPLPFILRVLSRESVIHSYDSLAIRSAKAKSVLLLGFQTTLFR